MNFGRFCSRGGKNCFAEPRKFFWVVCALMGAVYWPPEIMGVTELAIFNKFLIECLYW